MFIQGMETLHLRMKEHSANGQKVAEHLSKHPMVERVAYPGTSSGLPKERADKYLSNGCGGLLGFEIKGGIAIKIMIVKRPSIFLIISNSSKKWCPLQESNLELLLRRELLYPFN